MTNANKSLRVDWRASLSMQKVHTGALPAKPGFFFLLLVVLCCWSCGQMAGV